MRIVVLDGHTMNPGDLDWAEIQGLGDCVVYPRTGPSELLSRAHGAEVLLTNKVVLSREVIQRLPALRYIGVTATGYNVVDLAAARDRGIVVTNVPSYSTASVAQLTFALLLELTHRTGHHADSVRQGRWSQSPDFCFWDYPLVELAGRTMGIVGWGQIGQAVGRIAQAFSMQVSVHTRSQPKSCPAGIRFTDSETLFRESDVITLHCPLTAETRHLVNRQRLGWMKREAFLLNTGRGPLVDEQALVDALNEGRIAGAGLDVLSSEPPGKDNPLISARNCVITPHVGWATRAARMRLLQAVAANVRAFVAGTPQNRVA